MYVQALSQFLHGAWSLLPEEAAATAAAGHDEGEQDGDKDQYVQERGRLPTLRVLQQHILPLGGGKAAGTTPESTRCLQQPLIGATLCRRQEDSTSARSFWLDRPPPMLGQASVFFRLIVCRSTEGTKITLQEVRHGEINNNLLLLCQDGRPKGRQKY